MDTNATTPTQTAPAARPAAPAAGTANAGGHQRIDQFKSDIAELEVKTPADGSERWYLLAGIISMVVGVVLILGGYIGASGTALVAEQIPYLLSGGALGVGFIIVGGALFVRFSMSRYLRFWLIREIYEQRAQTDRLVESLGAIEALLADRQGR